MPIHVQCNCGVRVRVGDKLAARRVKCPSCGQSLAVPDAKDADPPNAKNAEQTESDDAYRIAEVPSETPTSPKPKKPHKKREQRLKDASPVSERIAIPWKLMGKPVAVGAVSMVSVFVLSWLLAAITDRTNNDSFATIFILLPFLFPLALPAATRASLRIEPNSQGQIDSAIRLTFFGLRIHNRILRPKEVILTSSQYHRTCGEVIGIGCAGTMVIGCIVAVAIAWGSGGLSPAFLLACVIGAISLAVFQTAKSANPSLVYSVDLHCLGYPPVVNLYCGTDVSEARDYALSIAQAAGIPVSRKTESAHDF